MKTTNIFVNSVGHAKEANSYTGCCFLMILMLKTLTFKAAEIVRNTNTILLSQSFIDCAMACKNKELFSCSFITGFSVFFWLRCTACGILDPQPGIEPGPSALKAQSPNYRTAREFPRFLNLRLIHDFRRLKHCQALSARHCDALRINTSFQVRHIF